MKKARAKRAKICKFVGFLLPSSSWLLTLPIDWWSLSKLWKCGLRHVKSVNHRHKHSRKCLKEMRLIRGSVICTARGGPGSRSCSLASGVADLFQKTAEKEKNSGHWHLALWISLGMSRTNRAPAIEARGHTIRCELNGNGRYFPFKWQHV